MFFIYCIQRAICQYRLFSRNDTWLPKKPAYVDTAALLQSFEVFDVDIRLYDTVGGSTHFDKYCGIGTDASETVPSTKVLQKILNQREVMADMATLEASAVLQSEMICEEPDGVSMSPMVSKEAKILLENMLKSSNHNTEGFLLWVRQLYVSDFDRLISPIIPGGEADDQTVYPQSSDLVTHRAQYLRDIKEFVRTSTFEPVVEINPRATMTAADIMRHCVRSRLLHKKDREAEKLSKKKTAPTGALKIVAAAQSMFKSIGTERFIKLTHNSGIDWVHIMFVIALIFLCMLFRNRFKH
jgi:hypothetical protein